MVELINSYIVSYGLVFIFILMLTNGLFSAPPSELTLALGGVWAASGNASLMSVVFFAVAGNITGAYILYFIGRVSGLAWIVRIKGAKTKRKWVKKIINILPNPEHLESVSAIVDRSSWLIIGVFRCLPVIRSIVSLPAGMAKMNLLKFTTFSMLGMTMWAFLWVIMGTLYFDAYQTYNTQISFFLILILSITLLVAYSYLNKLAKRVYLVEHNKKINKDT